MSSFTDPLVTLVNDAGTEWTLTEPFRYWIDKLHEGDVLTLPKGTKTDFASVPKLFWNILPPFGPYGKPAVVHDFLYRNGGNANVAEEGQTMRYRWFSRSECDKVFLDAMACIGVSKITRYFMYYMVRMFGKSSYRG